MARKIDFSKPLSPEELAYVNDRPWLIKDAELRGEGIISDDDFIVEDFEDDETEEEREERELQERNDEQGRIDEAARLADGEDTESEEEGDSEDAGEGDSEEESDSEEEESEGDEEEVAPYDEWDYQELKDEAKRRDLSAGGSKEQLIKRLQSDDDNSSPE